MLFSSSTLLQRSAILSDGESPPAVKRKLNYDEQKSGSSVK